MIMHGGHVRAFGDPLFLKQTYGKGYQVNLTVPEVHSKEAQDLVATVLPDSTCAVDETASSLAVTVPSNNLRGLPRLFTWLESSARAAFIVKEWGISNTTLEQVFLRLCDLNTEINNVSGLQTESNRRELCPMCRVNLKNTVFVRNLDGKILIVPDSLCWDCVNNNDSYTVTEDQVAFALNDSTLAQDRLTDMLAIAQSKAEAVTTQQMLSLENTELNEVLDTFQDENEVTQQPPLQVGIVASSSSSSLADGVISGDLITPVKGEITDTKEKGRLTPLEVGNDSSLAVVDSNDTISFADADDRADGAPVDQVKAIFIKNLVLQSKQKCSNCCAVAFVALMFLMLYVMSLLFQSAENITVCDAGYLTEKDCSVETLVQHVFSGSWDDMVNDAWEDSFFDDDTVGPYGYTIKYYMVPSMPYRGNIEVFGESSSNYYRYGFSNMYERNVNIWSSFSDSPELLDVSQPLGLVFSSRAIPEAAATSGDAPNTFMWANQLAVAASIERSQDTYPHCDDYAEDFFVNTTSRTSVLQNFSDMFADCVFYCEECNATSSLNNYTDIFFDGTVWVADQCKGSSCEVYPYAFLNYHLEGVTRPYQYLGDDACPISTKKLTLNDYSSDSSNTFRVMSYLNLLSNALLNPTLQTFDIQGGISPYGDLNFDAQLISQNLANILTVIAMMLLNGFWPLAVWRLAHERANNIVLMVHTSGMRKLSYMSGMFLFDMTVSVVSGVGMIVFAVLLELSRFDGAPVGYLVIIVMISAGALNAGAQLMVILSRKKASVLPLVAPCLMVASVVTSSLLNILVYPTDGEWKWPLNIYPFLAQGRALYIILVYHRGTSEVDEAIVTMALFCVVCLILSLVLEMESELRLNLKTILVSYSSSSETSTISMVSPGEHDEENVKSVDEDVYQEKELAMAFESDNDGALRDATMAIVIQQMRHVFPNGFQAVKNLSLALKYGECFGLLGPNGAGKAEFVNVVIDTDIFSELTRAMICILIYR